MTDPRLPRSPLFPRLSLVPLAALSLVGCGTVDEPVNPLPGGAAATTVELLVDDLGITHVYAKSDEGALFGAGYAMAKDRLFQMEATRRGALGTSAELFGASALKQDILARTIDFKKLGVSAFAALKKDRPEEAALMEAWIAGINARISEVKSGKAPLPYGFGPAELNFMPEPWTAEHAIAVSKVLAFGLSESLSADILTTALQRFGPESSKHLAYLTAAYDAYITPKTQGGKSNVTAPSPPKRPVPPSSAWAGYQVAAPAFASNNWAVSGAHTKNQRPLVAGDPHQQLTSPSRFWPVHMNSAEAGGTLDVIGFSFVGTPMVQLGHNAHIGWTGTTNFADVMDLWDVTASATSILLGGQAHPIVTRAEIIRVHTDGSPVGTYEDHPITVSEVPGFGVLLPDEMLPLPRNFIADGSILFNWTGMQTSNETSGYLALDRAADMNAFEAAVDEIEVGATNFVAADAKGIDYRSHAQVPDRGDPASHPMPWHMLSGDDAASLWTRGSLPVEKLPHLRDPARGFLVTANNDPFGFTADGNVENDPYYYGGHYESGFRAHRIEEALTALLKDGGKVDRADMEALQGDVHSPMADTLLPHLADAISAVETDPALAVYKGRADLTALAAKLAAWDRRFDRTRPEPVIFFAMEWFAAKRVLQEPFTPPLFNAVASGSSGQFLMANLRNILEKRVPESEMFLPQGRRPVMLAALADAAAWLTTRFGSPTATFTMADVHGAEFASVLGGKLEVPRVSVGGSFDTVNVSVAPFFDGDAPRSAFTAHAGSLYRMVVGFADDGTPEATLDFARGASGEPGDPHFADQQERWLSAGHMPLPFRRADVEARVTAKQTLEGVSR